MAEGARLEIVCSAKSGTEGSNPSLSARKTIEMQMNADFQDIKKKKWGIFNYYRRLAALIRALNKL